MTTVGAYLIYIGTAVLGLAIAYGLYRWQKFKREATPREIADRERATRENFDKLQR